MQKASDGKSLTELMEDVDSKLTYGGARKVSKYESELLDQLDESFDYEISLQRELDSKKKKLERDDKTLNNLHAAISEYCSETTRNKILLSIGWQFSSEEQVKEIKEALSDRELIEEKTKNSEEPQRYNK